MSGLAFLSDLARDNTFAYGILYAPLVATAVFHKRSYGVWILAAIACACVVIGAFVPSVNPDLPDLVANRLLSILTILATAVFVRHARGIQERLAEETRRAEAAERIKTEVLTNLSEEIRTPLHSLLGVMSLMMADCRPDQREALRRVRSGGKQLLETIDNLIDLTHIDELTVRQQPIDVATIVRDAAYSARPTASERQVTISMDRLTGGKTTPDATVAALGDSWATRRIIDNLLANAVRFTPPGGTVSVSVDRDADTVTASVSDTGNGLPFDLTEHFLGDAADTDGLAVPTAGGTGLALSDRLARAMNGRLIARNRPGSGATIGLTLPAADRKAA
ncbi:MAG: HAMP domain-containing sensor histidine kinase [Rhodopila sp.]|nr:HAMP domain-containing sensor histidine kinase [Rhodopila sp.]